MVISPPKKQQKLVLIAMIGLVLVVPRLALIRVTFVPCRIAEWFARVDRVRSTLAIGIGDFAHRRLRESILENPRVCGTQRRIQPFRIRKANV